MNTPFISRRITNVFRKNKNQIFADRRKSMYTAGLIFAAIGILGMYIITPQHAHAVASASSVDRRFEITDQQPKGAQCRVETVEKQAPLAHKGVTNTYARAACSQLSVGIQVRLRIALGADGSWSETGKLETPFMLIDSYKSPDGLQWRVDPSLPTVVCRSSLLQEDIAWRRDKHGVEAMCSSIPPFMLMRAGANFYGQADEHTDWIGSAQINQIKQSPLKTRSHPEVPTVFQDYKLVTGNSSS